MEKLQSLMKSRPQVVVLGAGASLATIPAGDKYGQKISTMDGFIETLGMSDILSKTPLKTQSKNLEEIYSELASCYQYTNIRLDLETRIKEYFSKFKLPDNPTIYDYLIAALTPKDCIASFNWDPLLFQAYCRVRCKITTKLPRLFFLHGNVGVGTCITHQRIGEINGICPKCRQLFSEYPLLYPIKDKDYTNNAAIHGSWNRVLEFFKYAYIVTIFGYSAPRTDKEALRLFKNTWGSNDKKFLEQFEFIDLKSEQELRKSWKDFIYIDHYQCHQTFFDSLIAKYPRRVTECFSDMTINGNWDVRENPLSPNMSWDDLKQHLDALLAEETT